MIVLEGISHTNRNISGEITQRETFPGNFGDFLMSDRWFTLDYKMDANIGLTTSSGLAEEVRRLMISEASRVQMPIKPVEPEILKYPVPIKPAVPVEPVIPETPKDRSNEYHFGKSMFTMGIVSLVVAVLITILSNVIFGIILSSAIFILSIPINFLRASTGNIRAFERHERELARHPDLIEKFKKDVAQYEEDLQFYNIEVEELDLKKDRQYQASVLYREQFAKYELEKGRVLKFRQLLWENSRVCTRCGTAYIGKN